MEKKLSKNDFADMFKERTKDFAIKIVQFCQKIPKTREDRIIADQLIRSGTSVGSNYRAACRGRSRNEFYAKLCIVVEEADETLFWLEIIRDSGISDGEELVNLLKEGNEILAIMATSRKAAGKGFN